MIFLEGYINKKSLLRSFGKVSVCGPNRVIKILGIEAKVGSNRRGVDERRPAVGGPPPPDPRPPPVPPQALNLSVTGPSNPGNARRYWQVNIIENPTALRITRPS